MDLSRLCPSKMRCPEAVQLISQIRRVDLHSCLLAGGLSNRLRPESDMIGIEAEDALEDGASRVRLPISRGALVAFPAGSVPAATGWRKIPILPSLMARRAAKYLSTSIFLIRAIAAPVALPPILCGLSQAAEVSELELAQASSRWVDPTSNGFAG